MLFVCGLIGILSVIALPGLLMAKQAAGSASAIGSLRAINSGATGVRADLRRRILRAGPDDAGRAAGRQQRGVPLAESDDRATSCRRSGYTIQLQGTPYRGAPATLQRAGGGRDRAGLQGGRRSDESRQPALLCDERERASCTRTTRPCMQGSPSSGSRRSATCFASRARRSRHGAAGDRGTAARYIIAAPCGPR